MVLGSGESIGAMAYFAPDLFPTAGRNHISFSKKILVFVSMNLLHTLKMDFTESPLLVLVDGKYRFAQKSPMLGRMKFWGQNFNIKERMKNWEFG